MKKVVFCRVAWMKYYNGVAEDDKPMNGGSYVNENGDGGEVFNFSPHNHICYGYVMHKGDEVHIERYDKIPDNHSEIEDMTVVWVATGDNGPRIIGWYEHATMYRYWQCMWDYSFTDCPEWNYNFKAKETDAFLIPEEKRSFVIPRASVSGKGRGMGQSNIWYADSEYAQEEVIPEVLAYLEEVKKDCIPIGWAEDDIRKLAADEGLTVDEIIQRAEEAVREERDLDALQMANLAVAKADNYETRMLRGDIYQYFTYYDEQEEDYKMALYYRPDDWKAMYALIRNSRSLHHHYIVISLGEELRVRRAEFPEDWKYVSFYLIEAYLLEGQLDTAERLLCECESEKEKYGYEYLESAWAWLEQEKRNATNRD